MPLDAIALGAVTNELNNALEDAKIEKIHQPERDEILLYLKNSRGNAKLAISANSANPRIHLVHEVKENPASPPMFCMLLRKHLTCGRIKSVSRVGFDRIADIEIECRNELGDRVLRHIICEIMGRNSNIIFTDGDGRIIDSIKHIDITVSSVRNILPGLKYMLPPNGDKINPENAAEDDFYRLLKNAPEGREAARAVSDGVMGISPLLAAECIYEACGDGNLTVGELHENDILKAALRLSRLFERAEKGKFSPCVLVRDDGSPADFAPFCISQYGERMKCIPAKSMNEAAESFWSLRDRRARMHDRSLSVTKIINNNIKRAEKKIDIFQRELKESANRDKYKIYGELITANLYKIQKGDTVLTAENYYEENSPSVEIPLDSTKTPPQNAARYFNKYKKAKNTEINAKEQLNIAVEELAYLESVLYSVQNAATPSELAEIREELVKSGYIRREQGKKKQKTPPLGKPMEFEYNGYKIYVGKNNVQNDFLTMKTGRARDLWLHTKNIPGSHTLIKFSGEDFPPDVIETAAKLAAYYSKGKNAPYVEVDYCPVSHVKKPNGAKAGMVIYEGYNTALVAPDEKLAAELRK